MGSHYWISAGRSADRNRLLDSLGLPPILARVTAHRRLRGPYTAAGQLLRAVGADALARSPELGPRHHIEILTAAPEFAGQVPPIRSTLEQQSEAGSRTRYQARLHTLRISHGLAEFIRDYLAARGGEPSTLVVEDLSEADVTDHEFVAVLLRRMDPDRLTVVVITGEEPLADPPGPVSISLPAVLTEYAGPVTGAPTSATGAPNVDSTAETPEPLAGLSAAEVSELARAHVAAECLGDDPRRNAAYAAISAAERTRLHAQRHDELVALAEPSLRLGAIPFHAERAGFPAVEVATALREAQLHCKNRGMYHAAAELGEHGRALLDRNDDPELWWELTGDVTTSLSAAGRAEEAERLYDEVRAVSIDPAVHMHAAYGTAMLFARHYGEDRRDPKRARRWLNQAVAIASLLPDPKERAFQSVFQRNGIALVETREGRPEEALRLLNEGMAWLDRELEPGEQLLHRTGLRYNRAQVYGMLGRLEEALADYSAVIEVDPNFHDHYFNRGNILRRLGRSQEAIDDYERALELSPPFPEAYYNRGDARLELGDVEGALADFDRVLEIDPEHVDARLNRAALRCEAGDFSGALADVTVGLAHAPGNAYLLCLHARILAEQGEADAARVAVCAALDADERLAEAWAIRAGLNYLSGDLTEAIDDFDHAVRLADVPEFRYNRALAYEEAGRYSEAADDYRAVLDATGDPDAAVGLERCRVAAASPALA